MAGASMKQIKTRIRSMRSTRQITKAMEMVASSKLRRAQAQALAVKPYFETLYRTIGTIAASNRDFSSPYLRETKGERPLYVVIAGDRGLAGGYNSNLFKLVLSRLTPNACVLPVGRKAEEFCQNNHIPMADIVYTQPPEVTTGDCFTLAKALCKAFREGRYDRLFIAYTEFVSVLTQQPNVWQLLPLAAQEKREKSGQVTVYEPSSEEVFDTIVPEYVGGILYGGLCESRASEHAARRTAMDAATKNADEMIGALSLQYNRARQAAITQEITEIIAGAKRS